MHACRQQCTISFALCLLLFSSSQLLPHLALLAAETGGLFQLAVQIMQLFSDNTT